MQNSGILKKFGLLAPKFLGRTGAWHPLLHFSGCLCIFGIRTAGTSVIKYIPYLAIYVFDFDHFSTLPHLLEPALLQVGK